MSFTVRELQARIISPMRLWIWAATTLICGFSGPYRSLDAFGPIWNFVFWAVAVALAIVLAITIDLALRSGVPGLKSWRRALVHAFLFSLIYSGLIWAVVHQVYPVTLTVEVAYWYLFVHCFVIAATVLLVVNRLRPAAQEQPELPVFARRLSPELGPNIWRVSSQNHYVDAQTDIGRETILLRFSDALAELQGLDGLQVHRSHWISRAAVAGVERGNGRIEVRLHDGGRVPVSRSFRTAAEAAGLI